jgi:hypothetical protein
MTAEQLTSTGVDDMEELERRSGIPPRGKFGASLGELKALLVGVAIFLLIIAAFLWQAWR